MIAAAFAPEPVIVRLSDFKSNEYANLIGGTLYEPDEENPMLGSRGRALRRLARSSARASTWSAKRCGASATRWGSRTCRSWCLRAHGRRAKAVVELLAQNGLRRARTDSRSS